MIDYESLLIEKLEKRTAVIGILGLGYVGIPLLIRASEVGFPVLGFDILEDRVDRLNQGESPIGHISGKAIGDMRQFGFEATTKFSRVDECDVLIICVPTPLHASREPDLSFVIATMETISPHLREGQLLSLESTTWPGTTREILLPYLEKKQYETGRDFFLVYSPEREDPGNPDYNTQTIPKIVGGHTASCKTLGSKLYGCFVDRVVEVSSTGAAEMVKLLENIHRSINIGLVNELKIVADAMGFDIFEIIDAAATKPFGFTAYYPGPGVGGHCIPIDPFYLTWKAREFGVHTRFIELAGEVNASMPQYVVEKTIRALNDINKPIRDSNVLVLGIAYKRNLDDVRESPSVFVMELLRDWGANVKYCDPNVPRFPEMRDHKFELESIELTEESIASFDAVLLLTDHSEFDYSMIEENSRILIDTRGKYRDSPSVVKA